MRAICPYRKPCSLLIARSTTNRWWSTILLNMFGSLIMPTNKHINITSIMGREFSTPSRNRCWSLIIIISTTVFIQTIWNNTMASWVNTDKISPPAIPSATDGSFFCILRPRNSPALMISSNYTNQLYRFTNATLKTRVIWWWWLHPAHNYWPVEFEGSLAMDL